MGDFRQCVSSNTECASGSVGEAVAYLNLNFGDRGGVGSNKCENQGCADDILKVMDCTRSSEE